MSEIIQPKVFISYSWSSPEHQELVKNWAERLMGDSVDVVIDIYDLKEGDDKYNFMERMVTDTSVTHVLVMCDEKYSIKSDSRQAGVGTESQIISKQVYEKVSQNKFIPIICQKNEEGNAFTPVFMASRIYIDFSTPERVNENWERLIRLLYGKPEHIKPRLGSVPFYITENTSIPATVAHAKYAILKNAVIQEKKRLKGYRDDFVSECLKFADDLRVREAPASDSFGKEVLNTLETLEPLKNIILEWVLLEGVKDSSEEFNEDLIDFLERLLSLKGKPPEIRQWNDGWFEAHDVFVYEVFLYVIAALMRNDSFSLLKEVFTHSYFKPNSVGSVDHRRFDAFYGSSGALQILADEGRKLNSPAAKYIKDHAVSEKVTFELLMEAELLTMMMSFIMFVRWFPQTLYYAGYHSRFPFFSKLASNKKLERIKTLTGIKEVEEIKMAIKNGHAMVNPSSWPGFHFTNFIELMNLDSWGELN